ncbi:acyclic terpene utilization AtuA family protein [Bacillus alveayuensis]|jgi:hypothetical protein|uniref:acyclic terpene utilization AtuA family protein n=1 Tax=Aeribacillus alveayuensis TaxID=279215 RepID=UPI0005CD9F3B|nr:acyclic terpene utilization AtuA family protein [Bacillus alveayuensis]
MKKVRVGAAQGFYGDSIDAALANAKFGNVDYLAFDCLAELTMAILAKDQQKDPQAGFTRDIGPAMKTLLPYVKEKNIKILTNAGGLHPEGAQQVVLQIAHQLGITDLKVAIVTGDNILSKIPDFLNMGISLEDLETKASFTEDIQRKLLFANAYIGAQPLVEALKKGADIVISGRTTDTAQFLAPLIYEFNWSEDDWDRLASGIFMGHLLECSAQSTGGNFAGNWEKVEGFEQMAYPIAEVYENGDFIITKVEECGGLVNKETVKEQMLYEIHDPSAYVTPDVIVDLTNVHLEETAPNEVKVTGVRGKKKPSHLKVVMGYENGYMGQVIIGYSWPDALKKAKAAEQIIRRQLKEKKIEFDEIRADFIGYNSLHGPLAKKPDDNMNEIYLRMVVKSGDKKKADSFRRLFPPLALNGPPTMTYIGNIPTRQLIGMWSALVPREEVERNVKVTIKEVETYANSDA